MVAHISATDILMHSYPNTELLTRLLQLTIHSRMGKLKFQTGKSKESWKELLDQQEGTGLQNWMMHYGPTVQLTRHPLVCPHID